MELEFFEADELEGRDVGGFDDDLRGHAGKKGFFPAGGAQAPLVAGFEAGEAVGEVGGAEVVAAGFGEGEKLFGDLRADNVDAVVISAGAAAAVAEVAGHGVRAAWLKNGTEDVFRSGGHAACDQ